MQSNALISKRCKKLNSSLEVEPLIFFNARIKKKFRFFHEPPFLINVQSVFHFITNFT